MDGIPLGAGHCLAAIRSRAGVILFFPAVVLSLLAARIAAGPGRPRPALLGLASGLAAARCAVAVFALPPLLDRFELQSGPESRFEAGWPGVALDTRPDYPAGESESAA